MVTVLLIVAYAALCFGCLALMLGKEIHDIINKNRPFLFSEFVCIFCLSVIPILNVVFAVSVLDGLLGEKVTSWLRSFKKDAKQ